MTNGRARSIGEDLALETLVRATPVALVMMDDLRAEQYAIIQLCSGAPLSIAEISAHLHVHLGVARVLTSDLAAENLVTITQSGFTANGPSIDILERLLDGLEALK